MSGPLAIAGVSAVLRDLLQTGMSALRIGDSVAGAASGDVTVSVGAPDLVVTSGAGAASQLNLFLYNVARNPGWANLGLPSRDSRGTLVDNPVLGLDLYYLITAYGQKDFDAEVLLGGALQVLHDTPGLDRDEIRSALSTGLKLPKNVQLCGLAEQAEQLRITPLPMSTEEIVRLWSAFQSDYRPSVAYQVSVLLLQASHSTRSALPVRGRNLYALTFRQPRLDSVDNATDPLLPITPDATLRLRGANLDTPGLRVQVAGIDLTAGITSRGPDQLLFTLLQPPAVVPGAPEWPEGLLSGLAGVQLVGAQDMGSPPVAHGAVSSNLLAVVLVPVIIDVTPTAPGTLRLTCAMPVGRDQHAKLLLNPLGLPPGSPPRGHSVDLPAGNGVVSPATSTRVLIATLPVLPAGPYVLRLRIDGADSPLLADASGVYSQPQVML